MLARFLWTALIALLVFVIAGLFLPSRHHVERSIEIDRPASLVFSIVNNYRHFNEWSPWARRDPSARYEFSGPESGAGSRMSWSGDPGLVGSGYQEITYSKPFERVEMRLEFDDQGSAQARFLVSSTPAGALVTWAFDTDVTEQRGPLARLMGKYFGLFLEKWVGQDYEQGLQALKHYAESLPDADFSSVAIEVIDVQPLNILYVPGSSSQAAEDVAAALQEAFGEINRFIRENGIELTGQPMAITRSWDENGFSFDAALPVETLPAMVDGKIRTGQSPSGKAVRMTYKGPYANMLTAYEQLAAYMAAHDLEEGSVSWEHYISDPAVTPEDQLLTHIYFLLKQPE